MRKSQKTGEVFGLTQEEMSGVLNIGRSIWSMFELGKRGLPAASNLLLAKMHSHMDSPEAADKRAAYEETEVSKRRSHLERLLLENKRQQLLLEKKAAAHDKIQDAALRRMQVVDFISAYHAENKTAAGSRYIPAKTKNFQNVAQNPAARSVDYELRTEMLRFEQKLIEAKLKAL